MDGVRKKRKLKFKKNRQEKQTHFDGWFDEFEFLEKNFSQETKTNNYKLSSNPKNSNLKKKKKKIVKPTQSSSKISKAQTFKTETSKNKISQKKQTLPLSPNYKNNFTNQRKKTCSTQLNFQKSSQKTKNFNPSKTCNLKSRGSEQKFTINKTILNKSSKVKKNVQQIKQQSNFKQNNNFAKINEQPTFQTSSQAFRNKNSKNNIQNFFGSNNHFVHRTVNNFSDNFKQHVHSFSNKVKDLDFSLSDVFKNNKPKILIPKSVFAGFSIFAGLFVLGFGFFTFAGNTFAVKENVTGAGERAVESIKLAADHVGQKDFQSSEVAIDKAYDEMIFASDEMNSINNIAVFMSEFIPVASQLSSGKHIVETGKYLTHAGKEMNSLASVITNLIESKDELTMDDISLLEIYQNSMSHISVIQKDVQQASRHVEKINLDDVPDEYRGKFADMKSAMPHIEESLNIAVLGQEAIEDILGANGPRKYLFLFQNNHEMRATGGFIGSYGLLEISDGKIQTFKVEGIFNPDGQLIDRIVPPLPIQKISADWSLHDSNWFPNFPTSAEKAIDFYERTGGPTVDGVITITPAVMVKILEITGSITLDEYDVKVNSNNFMQVIQSEVEEDYDKEENKPKKILSDLTPMVFEKLISDKNPKNLASITNVLSKSLDERHILIYMRNDYIQDVVSQNDWSGEIIETDKDYLSVINSNINGFKTDGVVDEIIEHSSEIHEDGSIINTVTITRKHDGGHTGFDWWDSVNSNYMRLYVPKGSRLLSVEGQTREINEERLDYDTLGYERDDHVVAEEENLTIDEESGTRIYEEESKTVFANWIYVSPQETARITYKYILPFKIDFNYDGSGQFGSYAVVYQKQAGSENSKVESEMVLPENFELFWETDDGKDLKMEGDLRNDLYHGVVFRVD
ncbi:MAG: DUF4012 domain-containing protein [Candidatus Moranbacteria bacterium]|nr:DUF4012 domain-containing protein [Candidatus Moranbacteria bacterium]